MKKLLILLTAALLTVSAHAKVGTIAGTYYSTDIVTSLNGAAITAINIGGNTLIDAEAGTAAHAPSPSMPLPPPGSPLWFRFLCTPQARPWDIITKPTL